jgi:phage-related protein
MASKNEAKIKFTAETGDFNEGIKKCDSQMTELRSELKLVDAQMASNGESAELLEKRQQILARQSEVAAQKSQLLAQKVEAAERIFGTASTDAAKYRTQLNNAQTSEERLAKSANDAANDVKQLDSSMDKASGSAKDFGSSVGDIALGSMIADGASSAIQSLAGLSDATEENRVNMNKLNTTYEWSGRSIDDARKVYQNFLGLCGDSDQAVEAAQDMNNLADAGADIDTWYDIASGTVAAFGDALPIENLIESANETIRTGQVTGGLADALNWTSVNADLLNTKLGEDHPKAMEAFNEALNSGSSTEDAMNAALAACSDEQERQEILSTVLASQYTELGASFQDANQDIDDSRKANDDLLQSQSKLSEKITPLQTMFTNLAADGIGFLADNLETVIPLVGAAAAVFGILYVALNFSTIVTGLTTAIGALGPVLTVLTGPVGIVLAAVAALAVVFKYLWDTNEGFRATVTNAWNQIQQAIVTVMTYLQPYLETAWTTLQTTVTNVMNALMPIIQNVLTFIISVAVPLLSSLFETFSSVFGNILTTVSGVMSGLGSIVSGTLGVIQGIFETVVGLIVGIVTGDFSMMSDGVSGILNGMSGIVSGIFNSILSIIGGIVNSIVSVVSGGFNAASATVSGVMDGISSVIGNVMGDAENTVSNAIDSIVGFFAGMHIEFPHINLPHFSLSGEFSLMPPSVPTIGIEWYAKGGIMTAPTLFGMNGGRAMVGGEAGPEAVLPISLLQDYIDHAFDRNQVGNNNEVNVTVYASGDSDDIANKVAVKVFGAIDQAMAANGR